MLLPPNNPNKKYKKNKNTSASTTPEKSIPSKLVSLAKKLQETIDHLNSSDSLDESGNENVDDITSLNFERILSPQKIPNNVQAQKSKKVRIKYISSVNVKKVNAILVGELCTVVKMMLRGVCIILVHCTKFQKTIKRI